MPFAITVARNNDKNNAAVTSSLSLSIRTAKFPLYEDVKAKSMSRINDITARIRLNSSKSKGKNIDSLHLFSVGGITKSFIK